MPLFDYGFLFVAIMISGITMVIGVLFRGAPVYNNKGFSLKDALVVERSATRALGSASPAGGFRLGHGPDHHRPHGIVPPFVRHCLALSLSLRRLRASVDLTVLCWHLAFQPRSRTRS